MIRINSFLTKIRMHSTFKTVLYWSLIASLAVYIFSIPSFSGRERFNLLSYGFMAILIVITGSYTFLFDRFRINKLFIFPIVFTAYAFLGTVFYSHEFRRWLTLPLMLLTMLTIYYSFVSINDRRRIIRILVYAILAFAFYFIIHYRKDFLNINSSFLRIGVDTYFDNVNTIGFYFSIGFVLSLFLSLFFERKIELLFIIPTIMFLLLGLVTGSRSFIVVVIISIGLLLFFRLKRKKIIFVICLVSIIGLFIIAINIPYLSFLKEQFDRTLYTIFGIGNSKIDASTYQRVLWQRYAWFLAGKNLLIGYGSEGFAVFSGVGKYAHNNYAEVACNFGIIGFVLFHVMFLIPVFYTFNSKHNDTLVVPILVSVYLIRNFFGVTYYSKDSYLVLALCYYLVLDCKFLNIKRLNMKLNRNHYYEVQI